MTDRPILFQTEMMRALLDGRKTQTRRIIKPQPVGAAVDVDDLLNSTRHFDVGDRLWTKERFIKTPNGPVFLTDAEPHAGPVTPSMFQPRSFSRVTLFVLDVKVERLDWISEADAIAEGILEDKVANIRPHFADQAAAATLHDDMPLYFHPGDDAEDCLQHTAVAAYRRLWESINGEGSWSENPYVFALTFNVHRCNIDRMP